MNAHAGPDDATPLALVAQFHDYLTSPEAQRIIAARARTAALRYPNLDPAGFMSEAQMIATEAAMTTEVLHEPGSCAECKGPMTGMRRNAKFCSVPCRSRHGTKVYRGQADKAPDREKAHVGSMWEWPESQRARYLSELLRTDLINYATRETLLATREFPNSGLIERWGVAA